MAAILERRAGPKEEEGARGAEGARRERGGSAEPPRPPAPPWQPRSVPAPAQRRLGRDRWETPERLQPAPVGRAARRSSRTRAPIGCFCCPSVMCWSLTGGEAAGGWTSVRTGGRLGPDGGVGGAWGPWGAGGGGCG